jgi:T4 RnlA family RNA ligase
MMFNVQQFLIDHGHDELTNQFGIRLSFHPTLPLVICNYDQLESPKTHPIVRECRGLILNSQTHELVARAFNRFFNWGEVVEEMSLFNFNDFSVQSKEDGSLVVIYFYDGQWRINTRGSFGLDLMQFQPFTWGAAILNALGVTDVNDLNLCLDQSVTYVGEFVSPWNKVVRSYVEPKVYLLSAFRGYNELSHQECDELASDAKVFLRPTRYDFTTIEQVQEFLTEMAANDATYEGVVICDNEFRRYKIKSPTYLSLHRMGSIKENLFNPKNLIPFILSGESDELLTYFSEVREALEFYTQQFDDICGEMNLLWNQHKGILDQKEFALKVKDHSMASMLFQARRTGETPEKILRQNPDFLLKKLTKMYQQPVGVTNE